MHLGICFTGLLKDRIRQYMWKHHVNRKGYYTNVNQYHLSEKNHYLLGIPNFARPLELVSTSFSLQASLQYGDHSKPSPLPQSIPPNTWLTDSGRWPCLLLHGENGDHRTWCLPTLPFFTLSPLACHSSFITHTSLPVFLTPFCPASFPSSYLHLPIRYSFSLVPLTAPSSLGIPSPPDP